MFCTNCGRPLADGEICECQKQKAPDINITPISPIAEPVNIESAPVIEPVMNEAVQQADATLNAAAAEADAVINNTPQADPIQEAIAKAQAEQAQAQAAATASAAAAMAQNADSRANQYYQQYAPQNQAPQQTNAQYSQPQGAPYGQYQQNAQQAPYGQYQSNAQQAPYGQYQPNAQQAPYGQYQQTAQQTPYGQYQQNAQQAPYGAQPQGTPYGTGTGQPYNRNNQYQGNPYANSQVPPAYYLQPFYDSEEERLKKFMSTPKFLAARDFMSSPIVLFYAISISAILLFNFIALQSFLHPLYILLCIGAWITFGSALSSKKSNKLPSTAGLSIGSGVAITMIVLWCIAFGLCILIMLLGIIGIMTAGVNGGGPAVLVLFIMLTIMILALVFGIKYYSLQSRNLKNVKFCITNEANPSRFSIFPSVILIIGIVLTIASFFIMEGIYGSTKLQGVIKDYLIDYFKNSGIDKIKSGYSRELADMVIEKIFSRETKILSYIGNILGICSMASQALIHMSAKSKLKDFSQIV